MRSVPGTTLLARKWRIAAYWAAGTAGLLLFLLGGVYFAVGRVRPFYEQALQIEPATLERGSREFESQATALYSESRQAGAWQALFTAEQINGWLALKLEEFRGDLPADRIRDPRVAITPDFATLGFRTTSGGMETVISVDAAPFVAGDGSVAIRLLAVRAGALPLPTMPLADELAEACQSLRLPVRWIQQEGHPVAMVAVEGEASSDKRQFFVDSIKLGDGELFLSGHTELTQLAEAVVGGTADMSAEVSRDTTLEELDLLGTPRNERSASEAARRARLGSEDRDAAPAR